MADSFDFAAVWRAYRACRRRKRGTANAQRYELRLLDRLVETATALTTRHYVPSRSLCFVVRRPKAREIHAADFADRVVHHTLVPRLEALYERVFIHDLYSNRKGKGTHVAVHRLGSFMRSLEGAGAGPVFALQLDVRNFFNRIDRPILLELVSRRVNKGLLNRELTAEAADDVLWLTRCLLQRDPAENVVRRGSNAEFARVPSHKRLANEPRLIRALWHRYRWLGWLFQLLPNGRLCPRWEPRSVTSLRSQWRYFSRMRFSAGLADGVTSTRHFSVVLMQVGNRIEVFGDDVGVMGQMAGIVLIPTLRCGFACAGAVPLAHLNRCRNALRRAGVPHMFVAEEGYLKGGLKRRVLRWFWQPENFMPIATA